jgi:hypothetical protein
MPKWRFEPLYSRVYPKMKNGIILRAAANMNAFTQATL